MKKIEELKSEKNLYDIFFGSLEKILLNKNETMIFEIKEIFGNDSFLILISCLLSLRARDSTVLKVCKNLFKDLKKPEDFIKIKNYSLEERIRKIGFFKKKAEILKSVSLEINEKFFGLVPKNFEDLVSIKGVGQKTANVILSEAFNLDYICVDTHVYRISKDLEITNKDNFLDVEKDLMNFFPIKYWKKINSLFVRYGQNIYKPNLKNRKNEDFFYLLNIIKKIKTLKDA